MWTSLWHLGEQSPHSAFRFLHLPTPLSLQPPHVLSPGYVKGKLDQARSKAISWQTEIKARKNIDLGNKFLSAYE
jgi:hypothetical protein